ncbi:MAG: cupin domain-containing protein, partial [Pseudomonadota bacterium]|nr:cupin domain-containing protein [Pseudomonadota bacterium]
LIMQQQNDIPLQAADLVWARKLLSVIGLEKEQPTPINSSAPIRGAAGITITNAECPPGTGPTLHAHRQTFETFTVLKGRFKVYWNDDGGNSVELDLYDTISVPPGVCRGFTNISDVDGILQVIISGGTHDMNDIDFTADCGEQIESIQDGLLDRFKETGFTFTAGKTDE